MQAMRVALAFGRHDVDEFLNELAPEDYEDWCYFFALEPVGWQADNLVAGRIGYLMAQGRTKRQLREADYAIQIRLKEVPDEPLKTPEQKAIDKAQAEAARWEAQSIKEEIAEMLAAEKRAQNARQDDQQP